MKKKIYTVISNEGDFLNVIGSFFSYSRAKKKVEEEVEFCLSQFCTVGFITEKYTSMVGYDKDEFEIRIYPSWVEYSKKIKEK